MDLSSVSGRLRSGQRPCSVCWRWITQVLVDGDVQVRNHGPYGDRCRGSGLPPAPAWTTARVNHSYL